MVFGSVAGTSIEFLFQSSLYHSSQKYLLLSKPFNFISLGLLSRICFIHAIFTSREKYSFACENSSVLHFFNTQENFSVLIIAVLVAKECIQKSVNLQSILPCFGGSETDVCGIKYLKIFSWIFDFSLSGLRLSYVLLAFQKLHDWNQ